MYLFFNLTKQNQTNKHKQLNSYIEKIKEGDKHKHNRKISNVQWKSKQDTKKLLLLVVLVVVVGFNCFVP